MRKKGFRPDGGGLFLCCKAFSATKYIFSHICLWDCHKLSGKQKKTIFLRKIFLGHFVKSR